MKKIGVLVSGGGTNLQATINAIDEGIIVNGRIETVLSSKETAYALEIAKKYNIDCAYLNRKNYVDIKKYSLAILKHMKERDIDLIVMAGFLSIIDNTLIEQYENKIINVHPSLIPAFCGKGFYGLKVHEAVLDRGVKITGATVHFVNDIPDGGPIILQKTVAVKDDDTSETLQKRVMQEAEWKILPMAISLFCDDKLEVKNGKVYQKVSQ